MKPAGAEKQRRNKGAKDGKKQGTTIKKQIEKREKTMKKLKHKKGEKTNIKRQ
jgi:hypothetical protein